ncbi:MAG: branched-chain-amino-acid transaminase [Myxococcota bacterium]|nr:branched-chain-amino-acid transaminase [Myxococcota bacterium]
MKVWIDGRVVDASEASIPVTDHGLLYGDGIFEGIRIYDRKVFRLNDHLARFAAGTRAIGLELPVDLDGVAKIVLETARAFGEDEAYLRLVVTRGEGSLGVDPTTCHNPQLFCIAAKIDIFSPARVRAGIDLVTVSVRRPALDALDPRVKSLNYLNSALAKREARLRGADEGLILNAAGKVAEASVANVFIVRDGALISPPPNDGSLAGITRDSVMQIGVSFGIEAREESLSRGDLLGADELFLTGSGARIVPVATLDGQSIGSNDVAPGARPVTRQVLAEFPAFTRRNGTPF